MCTLPLKVHKLEQDIIQFKSSQAIGSSSSRVKPTTQINWSGSIYGDKYIIGVFKAKDTVHPLIMPRLTVKINGQVVPDSFQNGQAVVGSNTCFMNNDLVFMLGSLYYWGDVSDNIFDEYTTGFYLQVRKYNDWTTASPLTVEGTVYATCEGTLTIYAHDA